MRNLTVFRPKSGSSEVTVVCSLHGDEQTPLFLAAYLLDKLKPQKEAKISLVAPANLLGVLEVCRECPVDHLDLNRVFLDLEEKRDSLSVLTAKEISKIAKESKLVIDVHNYVEMITKPVAYFFADDNYKRVKQICRVLRYLEIPFCKEIFADDEDKYFKDTFFSSLVYYLSAQGIPAFSLELSPAPLAERKFLERLAEKILNLPQILEKDEREKIYLEFYKKEEVLVSNNYGVFVTSRKVKCGQYLRKGQTIGEFYQLTRGFEKKMVKNTLSGYLRSVSYPQFIKPNQVLAIIVSKYKKCI